MSDLSPGGRAFFEATRRLDEPTDADRQRIRDKTLAAIAAAGAAGAAGTVASKAAATAAGHAIAPTGVAAGWGGAAVKGALLAVAVLVGQSAIDVATGHDWLGRPAVSVAPSAKGPSTAVAPPSGETRESPDGRPGSAAPSRAKALDASAAPEDGQPPTPPRLAPRPGSSEPSSITPAAPVVPEASAATAVPAVPAASAMDEEIAALRKAQESLRAGKPADAVRVLDRYEATHTGVALEEERRAARIVAACKAGGAFRSSADAERFLRERPDSPLAERVRAACSDKTTP